MAFVNGLLSGAFAPARCGQRANVCSRAVAAAPTWSPWPPLSASLRWSGVARRRRSAVSALEEAADGSEEAPPSPAAGERSSVEEPSSGEEQGCRVYVGNLSYETENELLREHMSQVGPVVHAEVLRKLNGRSVGGGVVQYESPEAVAAAIAQLHDTELDNRRIFVREDRESNFRTRESDLQRTVNVSNLPYTMRWQELKDVGKVYGSVVFASVGSKRDGRGRGTGSMLFAERDAAVQAVDALNGKMINGREIGAELAIE